MRLIVARCEVSYIGRPTTVLPEAVRLLMLKADGTFMVWADGGGPNVKPLNWMIPPTVIEEERDAERPSRRAWWCASSAQEERLEIAVAEVLADVEHELDVLVVAREGGARARTAGAARRRAAVVRRGLPARAARVADRYRAGRSDVQRRRGRVDRGGDQAHRARSTSVEQLTRYLERIRLDPALGSCRGVLAAQVIKPQARVLAQARGIDCVEVDLEVLRGEREPELRCSRHSASTRSGYRATDG